MLDWIVTRWPLKLLALGLAFAIWLTVTGESRTLRDYQVPLDISLSDEVVLLGSSLSTVNVRLRGAESLVRGIDPLLLAFQVDLTDAVPGERSVLLTTDRLTGVPKGVEITQIEPDRVNLTVDRRMRRLLPVEPSLLGTPPEGYAFYSAEILPDKLEVEGPEVVVAAMTRLRTEPIRLDRRTEPFSVRVAAVPDSPEIRVLDPSRLEVRIAVDVEPEEATFDGIPVVLEGQAYEAVVRPTTLQVTLAAPPDLLAGIAPEQIRAVVDVSGLAPGQTAHNVPVRIDLVDMPPRDLARVTVKAVNRREISVHVSDRRISE